MRILTFLAMLGWVSCGAATEGIIAARESEETPAVVRARCGSCHGLPRPDARKESGSIRSRHEARMRLSPQEWETVWTWLFPAPSERESGKDSDPP